MKPNHKLAIIAVLLAAGVVALGLYTAGSLFSGAATKTIKHADDAGRVLKEARSAAQEGRFQAALDAARRAAALGSAQTQRAARIIEARALTSLDDPGAHAAWTAVLNDTRYTTEQRAEAVVRLAELCTKAEPPDLAGAVAAYQQAIADFPGTDWADRAAIALADVQIESKRPELAKNGLTDYAVKAKDPELIQAKIGDTHMAILFSPIKTDVPKCIIHTVKPGDTLDRIAAQYHTTVDLLQESNRIKDPRRLQIGDRLKVVTDSFRIVIDKSENTLSLFCHDTLIKKYRVGTGEYDKTPTGDFMIVSKDKDPPWRGIPFGDPRNVLGTRWMKITDKDKTLSGYGIHGTWEPETIGTYMSQGCIRLLNEDVEEIFKIVRLGTPVSIVE